MVGAKVKISLLNTVAVFALVVASVHGSHAQTESAPANAVPKVVLSTPRTTYKVGEVFETTATLENAGASSFYVPKSLAYSTGNTPGFRIQLWQNGQPYCQMIADYICSSAEQKKIRHLRTERILNEHFLLLPPGGLIGIHLRVGTSCPHFTHPPTLPPGKYEVTVTYWTNDPCIPDLSNRHANFPIVQSRVTGTPIEIELTK